MSTEDPRLGARWARQRTTILVLAFGLIIGGLLLLFVLKRMPLPMRILAGLGDLVAGYALLIVARQKFFKSGPPPTA
ncbi:MAG: hypothetical protein EXS38_02660 [Opitutus sp.]|nr:hypothetical protein [Opitutus sp.]